MYYNRSKEDNEHLYTLSGLIWKIPFNFIPKELWKHKYDYQHSTVIRFLCHSLVNRLLFTETQSSCVESLSGSRDNGDHYCTYIVIVLRFWFLTMLLSSLKTTKNTSKIRIYETSFNSETRPLPLKNWIMDSNTTDNYFDEIGGIRSLQRRKWRTEGQGVF